jgi:DNA-binding CsgD family transcriptional regulator
VAESVSGRATRLTQARTGGAAALPDRLCARPRAPPDAVSQITRETIPLISEAKGKTVAEYRAGASTPLFQALCEALDLTTPSGRALAGMLAVFAEFEREILRERVKAGIAQARARGQPHGRPPTVKARSAEIKRLFARGLSKREIAKRLKVGRTSVRRVLTQKGPRP